MPFCAPCHPQADLKPCSAATDCYFVEKAFNAEQAGYKAIMVADNVEEGLLTMALPEDRPEIAKLIDDITIPTALVTKVGSLCSKVVQFT